MWKIMSAQIRGSDASLLKIKNATKKDELFFYQLLYCTVLNVANRKIAVYW
jgi:hypothetical protein